MKSLFIANRGEIAVRVIRTARKMGIETIVGVTDADSNSLAARLADRTIPLGPSLATKSYLNIERMMEAIRESGADAVHPGSGFLSENADFAAAVIGAGLIWVGPKPETIRLMGDKNAALATARSAGVPILPGSDGPLQDSDDVLELAQKVGFPLVVKASAGGGGRGIRLVENPESLLSTVEVARSEAAASFANSNVYLEKYVRTARHVEVQILGDGHNYVHLGDRDCSLQRKHQKLVEEAPAPDLPEEVREKIYEASLALAAECNYEGAGTVEFLYNTEEQEPTFLEMNTRIQVEHPITEELTGIDIVEYQLKIAAGEPLDLVQSEISWSGHAIEVRVNAEDPSRNYLPSPGDITKLAWPEAEYIRVDSGFEEGDTVSPYYDSMIAKVIVSGDDRDDAITKLLSTLRSVDIEGIHTTIPVAEHLVSSQAFRSAQHNVAFVEHYGDLDLPGKER